MTSRRGGKRTQSSRTRIGAAAPSARVAPAGSEPATLALGAAFLGALLVALHARAFRIPFLSDDYAFLDQGSKGLIPSLVHAFTQVPNYFRPLGREVYFWALTTLAGDHVFAFHLANFGLLLATVLLVALVGALLAGVRAGLLAAGVYALVYPHRVELAFVSCSQDLIATALAILAALLHLRGRRALAAGSLFLALLSKESVATLPLVLLVWEAWRTGSRGWPSVRTGLRRTLPLWLANAAWAALVVAPRMALPQLHTGTGGLPVVDVALDPSEFATGFRLAMLTYLGLEQPWTFVRAALPSVLGAGAAVALAAAFPPLAFLATRAADAARADPGRARGRDLLRLGLLWATIGALPVAVVGQRFNAYYVSFSAVGFALLAAALLVRVRPWIAAAGFAALAGLNVAANATQVFRVNEGDRDAPLGVSISSFARIESDARYVDLLHRFLLANPPARGAVIYFSQPFGYNLMGTGGEHAPRVWFRDPTLRTKVLRSYVPGESSGPKLFLRYDVDPPRFSRLSDSLATAIVEGEEALRQDRAASARASLTRALALATPGIHDAIRVELRNALGVAQDKLGDTAGAQASWRSVLELAPSNRGALINLAASAMDRGQFAEARQWIDRALAADPDDALAQDYARRIDQALRR